MLQAPPPAQSAPAPAPWKPSTTTKVFMAIGGVAAIGLIWWAAGSRPGDHRWDKWS